MYTQNYGEELRSENRFPIQGPKWQHFTKVLLWVHGFSTNWRWWFLSEWWCFVLLPLQSECEQRGESYWHSVTASVVTKIVENIEVNHHRDTCRFYTPFFWIDFTFRVVCSLQLNIQGVHLRFEDDFSDPGKPFSFGVCINNVSAQNSTKEPVRFA